MIEMKCFVMGNGGTNCYVLTDSEKNCVIIDCEGDAGIFEDYFEKNNRKPSYIILTHGHGDHISAVDEIKEKYGCKVCAGEHETRVLQDPAINLSCYMGGDVSIIPDVLLKDGETFTVGEMSFKVMHTPGHTEGSICLLIGDCIISGDTLFQGSCGRTDFETGDYKEIIKSLKKLSELKGDYKVFPGHGPSTTLDYERKNNPFMRG